MKTWKASIERSLDGHVIVVPILPRGHARTGSTEFRSRDAAVKAVMEFSGPGQAVIVSKYSFLSFPLGS